MDMRKQSMLRSQKSKDAAPGANGLRTTTVKRVLDKKKHELVPLSPGDKLLIALRKVLVKMSIDDQDGSRFFISGTSLRITEQPQAQVVKEGEFASYRGAGYAKVGVSLKGGEMAYRFINFSIHFRDCLNENGLPDVEFFDPTEVDDVGLHHPEVAGL